MIFLILALTTADISALPEMQQLQESKEVLHQLRAESNVVGFRHEACRVSQKATLAKDALLELRVKADPTDRQRLDEEIARTQKDADFYATLCG